MACVSSHVLCPGILPSPTPPMAGQTRCLAKVWQAGHLFVLLIPREHGHLVGNVIRGPKSLSGQRTKVVVTRLRDVDGEFQSCRLSNLSFMFTSCNLHCCLSWTERETPL